MPNPKLTTRIKNNRGTDRADRKPKKSAVEHLSGVPLPPKDISKIAHDEWIELAPIAFDMGTLTRADLRAFQQLCEILATQRVAQETLTKDGITLSTAAGGLKTHPAVKILEAARAQAIRLFESFGLTPRGRQHVDIIKPNTGNEFDDI